MLTPLRVLLVEDHQADCELILHELGRAGFEVAWQRVETEPDFLAQLGELPDIILADYTMPQFGALRALSLLRERGLDVPFIVVSGNISEEVAVECIKQGATDYLLKDRLVRLGQAVMHALDEKKLRSEKARVEAALRESEERFRLLAQSSLAGVYIGQEDRFSYVNPALADIFGYVPEEVIGVLSPQDLTHPADRALVTEYIRSRLSGEVESVHYVFRGLRKDGAVIYCEVLGRRVEYQGRVASMGTLLDITERKQAEEELSTLYRALSSLFVSHDLGHMAQQAAQAIGQEFTQVDCGVILLDESTHQLARLARAGEYTAHTSRSLTLDGPGLVPRAIRSGEPLYTPDVSKERDYVADDPRTRSELVIPLRVGTRSIGALDLQSPEPAAFNERDLRVMRAFAERAAIALENAQLYTAIRRHAAELEDRVRERTAELEAANAMLKELDRLKSKFVADVSHELRTPLTVLNTRLYLLQHGRPEQYLDHIQILSDQIHRLSSLVENILDISRLELGKEKVRFAPVNLNETVEQVVHALRPRAEAAGLKVSFEPVSDLPPVWGESNQLSRIVTNLVANAINYTTQGYVRVRTGLDSEQRRVWLEVQDTGMGIAPEDLPHLFQRFYRGQRAVHSNIPGTGLGLSIVKEIVEMHDGHIEVESQVGKGTTFSVALPLAATPAQTA